MTIQEITNATQRRAAEAVRIAYLHQQAANAEVEFALTQLDAADMEVVVSGTEILSFDFTETPAP